MAWIMERAGARGTTFMGVYRDPDGHKRSAGSFSTRREAQRAANREEQKVLAGSWHDSSLGDITFREYVEAEWLPNKHVEASTRAAYVSNLNKHFYPFFGTAQVQPDLALAGAGLGHPGPRRGALAEVDPQVPRLLVLDLRPGREGPGPGLQPVRPHRAAQGDHSQVPHPDPTGVRPPPHRAPRPAPADDRDPDRGRPSLGRAHRAQAPPHRLPAPRPHRGGDDRGGLQEALPHRAAVPGQALPQGQRTPHLRRPPGLARRRSPSTSGPTASGTTTCCSRPRLGRRSRATPSAPGSGSPPSRPAASTSVSASTICATPTRPGCSPAGRTSSPSWNGWATPRSRPPRNTSTPSPTPTSATSTRSRASRPGTRETPLAKSDRCDSRPGDASAVASASARANPGAP